MGGFGDVRAAQVAQLQEYLRTKVAPALPRVLLGDMNDEPSSPPVVALTTDGGGDFVNSFGARYVEFPFTTFKLRASLQRRVIDYVLLSPSLAPPLSLLSVPPAGDFPDVG